MFAERMLPRARERLVTINGSAPVKDAAALMAKPHTDLVVVCGQDGKMVGVLTKTDIVGQITRCMGSGCTARVDTIMTRDVASCQTSEPLQDIWSMMKARGLQRIPVVDQIGKPVGIIYARDALQTLLGAVESDEALLRDYVMNVGYHIVTRRTPEFTHHKVPPALLSAHKTKGGAWALIHVLEGKLRYCIEAPPSESILEPGRPGVIQPQVPHHVEPIGPVRFYLEFHRAPKRSCEELVQMPFKGGNCMPEQGSGPSNADLLRQRTLSRWDNEGGAGPDAPQTETAAAGAQVPMPSNGTAEVGALHIRIIALENLVISLLATASDQQLEQAGEMARYISPRSGFTRHPLTTHAAAHMVDLVERASRFRNRSPP